MNKILNKFIEENRNNIILCGESCIGKSHFAGHNLNNQKVIYGLFGRDHDTGMKKAIEKGKKIIILGAPYFIWRERVKERRKNCPAKSIDHLDRLIKFDRFEHVARFKENYVRYIKKLRYLGYRYILVACMNDNKDNRNDYPILDESNFLTMLQQIGEK